MLNFIASGQRDQDISDAKESPLPVSAGEVRSVQVEGEVGPNEDSGARTVEGAPSALIQIARFVYDFHTPWPERSAGGI